MMAMQASEAAAVMQGRLHGEDVAFTGIGTDSRTLPAGALFFALNGPHFDGHDYLEAARGRGAAAAAVGRDCASALPQINVADTRLALGRLAADWRARFDLPVIGITGSNGKTTVRAMTSAILARCGRALATQGNLNNDIGLPLTLARLGSEDRFAVIEMGASHPGEIGYLAGLARPTIAVITNAGPAHLEGFGSVEGVAHAKGELFAKLDRNGTAVINADDRYAPVWRKLAAHCRRVEFGLDGEPEVTADWQGDVTGSTIDLHTRQGGVQFRLALPGRHNVMNALAASAAALQAGADLDAVASGLEGLGAVGGRFNIHAMPGDITLIDDTYNANPESLQVALEVLVQADGERWLVLGDMGELGEDAPALHAAVGGHARDAGVTRLFALGELARAAADSFGAGGNAYASMDALLADLHMQLHGPLHILVKGSRRMRMERAVQSLMAGEKN